MPEVRVLTDPITQGGESPFWHSDEERVYWIDNVHARVFCCTADGEELTVWSLSSRLTAVAPRRSGGLVCASGRRVVGFETRTGEVEALSQPDGDVAGPFNDATVDRQGRFVTGSVDVSVFGPDAPTADSGYEPTGRLHRLSATDGMRVLAEGIAIVNGPCFDPEGSTFYCADSWARTIYAFDYDVATGTASNRRTFVRFEDDATPDGATVDSEGGIWVACFGGGEVRRYAPDAALDRRVPVPVQHPTSVAFGGADLDVLFVTSHAGGHIPGQEVPTGGGPLDGRLFAVHGLGVRGLTEPSFDG